MTLHFDLDPRRFEGAKTNIKRPTEIAYYSIAPDATLHISSLLSLRYYYPPFPQVPHVPPRSVDLKKGFEQFQRRNEGANEHLDHLLATLEDLERRQKARVDAKFVTWRGMITKLVTALYDEEAEFEMLATSYQVCHAIDASYASTLTIAGHHVCTCSRCGCKSWTNPCSFIEEDAIAKKNIQDSQRRSFHKGPKGIGPEMMEYWGMSEHLSLHFTQADPKGYKFEALSLVDRPVPEVSRDEIESRDAIVVENTSQYCSIVETGLGAHKVIIGGEVDGGTLYPSLVFPRITHNSYLVMGYKPERSTDPSRWIELKTARMPERDRDFDIHAKKLFKFWAQSYLIGCSTIIIGYRDREGWLYKLEELATQSIPNLWKRRVPFNANACLAATSAFLDQLSGLIDGPGVWRISKTKNRPSIVVEREGGPERGTGDIVSQSFKAWRESDECAALPSQG